MTAQFVKLSALFDVNYGVNLELNKLTQCSPASPKAVNFVSRTRENNGVSAIVELIDGVEPIPSGTISVAGGGNSVLYSFLQPAPYYSGRDLLYLVAKRPMSDAEKLFYCLCIFKNRFRYSYGRQANRTLGGLLVPAMPPSWVHQQEFPDYSDIAEPDRKRSLSLSDREWEFFLYSHLFDIKKGKRILNRDMVDGSTPCVRPVSRNNGVHRFIDVPPNHGGNVITVNYNGSVGEAFYQPIPIFALDDVNVLYPKFQLTPPIAMFLVTLMRKEQYRYSYGRKWHLERMRDSRIKLPVTDAGAPDWEFMDEYVRGLPYSRYLATAT